MSSNPAGWEKPEPFSSASPGKINKKSHFIFTHCQLGPICSISHSCGFLLRHLPKAFNTSLSRFSRFALWWLDTIKAFVWSPRQKKNGTQNLTQHENGLQHGKHGSHHDAVLRSGQQVSVAGRSDAHCGFVCGQKHYSQFCGYILWVEMGCVRSKLPDLVPSCGQGLRCGVLNRWSRILQVSLAPGSESCSLQAADTHMNMSQPESSIKRH